MHTGQLVFAQVMAYLPLKAFSRMVAARRAQHKVQDFSCLDQFLVLAFALQNGFSQYLDQRKSSQAVGSLCGFGNL